MSLHVAVVSGDPSLRERAARAFDRAPQDWRVTLDDACPERADVVVTGPEVDPSGDLVFDGTGDLVDAIRSFAAGARCIRVGGMPGAGGTSIALHLGAALASAADVCVLDRDPQRGAAHRLLLEDPPVYRAGDDVTLAAVPSRGGFRLLCAPDPGADPIEALRNHFGVVVVDGALPRESDVVVLQPTVPQARRLKALLSDSRPPVIVTNRLGRGGESTRRVLEGVLGRRIALELPHTPSLRDAEDAGHLVPTWTRWWRALERLARALGT